MESWQVIFCDRSEQEAIRRDVHRVMIAVITFTLRGGMENQALENLSHKVDLAVTRRKSETLNKTSLRSQVRPRQGSCIYTSMVHSPFLPHYHDYHDHLHYGRLRTAYEQGFRYKQNPFHST